jgi:hypothetical protein
LQPITVFEIIDYQGQSKPFEIGNYRIAENENFTSIKITPGFVAVIYQYADEGGGYGLSVDLMEDCPDISKYISGRIAYIIVFNAINPSGHIYARNKIKDGQFVAGHWERKRANGVNSNPNTSEAVVAPIIPPHTKNITTVLENNGAQTLIKTLGEQGPEESFVWQNSINDQMGIIGNDYRGIEEIGSAAFQREFTGSIAGKVLDFFGASNINFWYPQKQPRDHRSITYFKRTLAGKLNKLNLVEIADILPDHDVNMFVEPSTNYQYLVKDAHAPELTKITEIGLLKDGDARECPKEFTHLEGEIDTKGEAKAKLLEMLEPRLNNSLCMYGIWQYDKGHCCQPEIHPAEQVWWVENSDKVKKYYLNVFCDASKRFWWRDQMDDGTKLKPWGAPPIKGMFAIAFEVTINNESLLNSIKKYEVTNVDHYNVIEYPNADQSYELIYQGKAIVSFIPHNNAFKVTYEKVGLAPGSTNKIRGFLVIETSVGTCTQVATKITVPNISNPRELITVKIPENSDPDKVDQRYERLFFSKVEGHYMFYISETNDKTNLPVLELR